VPHDVPPVGQGPLYGNHRNQLELKPGRILFDGPQRQQDAFEVINYGSGNVYDETIKDANEPLDIKWCNCYIRVPISK